MIMRWGHRYYQPRACMATVCTQRESKSPQRASVDELESGTETLWLVLCLAADDERIKLCHTF